VSDIKIGGVPIDHGGQIAECITVKLIGAAARLGAVKNSPRNCLARCCIDPNQATVLSRPVLSTSPVPIGKVPAFESEDEAVRADSPRGAASDEMARVRARGRRR